MTLFYDRTRKVVTTNPNIAEKQGILYNPRAVYATVAQLVEQTIRNRHTARAALPAYLVERRRLTRHRWGVFVAWDWLKIKSFGYGCAVNSRSGTARAGHMARPSGPGRRPNTFRS